MTGETAATWAPPPRSMAVFSIDAVAPDLLDHAKCQMLRQEFYSRFDIPFREYGHSELKLSDPRWPALLDAIAESTKQRLLGLRACWIEEPSPKATDPNAWFIIGAGHEFKSPARTPAHVHFSWESRSMAGTDLASERCREVVEKVGLSGLDWLPWEKTTARDPMRWFQVFATHPIGRGLDHPLLDATKCEAERTKWKKNPWDPARRWGENVVWFERFLREDVTIDDPIIPRLYALSEPRFFRVAGPRRYVREHLPAADFAYCFWPADPDKPPGTTGRYRNVCCNARARAALIEAGLLQPARFEPMATVPAAEARAAILDRITPGSLPPPVFTPEEAAAERARREDVIRRAPPAPEALSFASVEEAAAYLERRLTDGTATWAPAREHPDFPLICGDELFERTPAAWQRLAPLLPIEFEAGEEDSPLEFQMAAPVWNDWLPDEPGEEPDETPSDRDLVIGHTPYGDWFAVRESDPLMPADGRVVHWNHETLSIGDEWPNVPAFAAFVVAACDAAAG